MKTLDEDAADANAVEPAQLRVFHVAAAHSCISRRAVTMPAIRATMLFGLTLPMVAAVDATVETTITAPVVCRCASDGSRSCSVAMIVVQHAAETLTAHNAAAFGCVVVYRLNELVAEALVIAFGVIVRGKF